MMHEQHHQDTYRHKQQSDGKQGIDLTNDLIHRKQRSKDIIEENHDDPEGGI